MGTERTGVEIAIEAQDQSAAAIGQSVANLQRWNAEVTKAKTAADGSYQSNVSLGKAVLSQAQAQKALSDEMRKATATTALLKGAQSELQNAMAASTGAISSQVAALTEATAAMGPWGVAAAIMIGALAAVGTASLIAANKIGEYEHTVKIMAQTTGLSEEAIGGLRVAASRAGVSFDEINAPLFIFIRHLGDAIEGNKEAIASFGKLGISLAQLKRESPDQVLQDTAAALSRLPTAQQRAADGFDLFGRGVRTILPVLAQSLTESEAVADALGVNLSPAARKVAEDAHKAGLELRLTLLGALNQLEVTLAPVGTALEQWATKAVADLKKFADFMQEHVIPIIQKYQALTNTWKVTIATPQTPVQNVNSGAAFNISAQDVAAERQWQASAADRLETEQKVKEQMKEINDLEFQYGVLHSRTVDSTIKELDAIKEKAASLDVVRRITAEITKLEDHQYATYVQEARLLSQAKIGLLPFNLPGTEGDFRRQVREGTRNGTMSRPDQFQELNPNNPASPMGPFTPVGVEGLPVSKELKSFLAQFEDWSDLLAKVTDQQGKVNEAMLGFLGTLKQLIPTAMQLGSQIAHDLDDAVKGVIHDWISGTLKIGEAFQALTKKIIEDVAVAMAEKFIFSAILGGQGGGTLAMAGAYAQGGGSVLAYKAQQGLIVDGNDAFDSVHLLAKKRETVLSPSLTNKLDAFLSSERVAQQRAVAPSPVRERTPAPSVSATVNVNGHFVDRNSLRQFSEEILTPMIVDLIEKRSYRAR